MKTITKGQFKILLDDEDYEWASKVVWSIQTSANGSLHYAYRLRQKDYVRTREILHRLIMGKKAEGKLVDHINGNGLDNRRSNLRVCTHSQNLANSRRHSTSGYKGVYKIKGQKNWFAAIRCNGQYHHLGSYARPEDAARAYNAAAVEYHGEFARLNKLAEPHQFHEQVLGIKTKFIRTEGSIGWKIDLGEAIGRENALSMTDQQVLEELKPHVELMLVDLAEYILGEYTGDKFFS